MCNFVNIRGLVHCLFEIKWLKCNVIFAQASQYSPLYGMSRLGITHLLLLVANTYVMDLICYLESNLMKKPEKGS